MRAGGTDAGHHSRFPRRREDADDLAPVPLYHSAIAMTTEKDIEAVIDLMVLMMAEISGGKL